MRTRNTKTKTETIPKRTTGKMDIIPTGDVNLNIHIPKVGYSLSLPKSMFIILSLALIGLNNYRRSMFTLVENIRGQNYSNSVDGNNMYISNDDDSTTTLSTSYTQQIRNRQSPYFFDFNAQKDLSRILKTMPRATAVILPVDGNEYYAVDGGETYLTNFLPFVCQCWVNVGIDPHIFLVTNNKNSTNDSLFETWSNVKDEIDDNSSKKYDPCIYHSVRIPFDWSTMEVMKIGRFLFPTTLASSSTSSSSSSSSSSFVSSTSTVLMVDDVSSVPIGGGSYWDKTGGEEMGTLIDMGFGYGAASPDTWRRIFLEGGVGGNDDVKFGLNNDNHAEDGNGRLATMENVILTLKKWRDEGLWGLEVHADDHNSNSTTVFDDNDDDLNKPVEIRYSHYLKKRLDENLDIKLTVRDKINDRRSFNYRSVLIGDDGRMYEYWAGVSTTENRNNGHHHRYLWLYPNDNNKKDNVIHKFICGRHVSVRLSLSLGTKRRRVDQKIWEMVSSMIDSCGLDLSIIDIMKAKAGMTELEGIVTETDVVQYSEAYKPLIIFHFGTGLHHAAAVANTLFPSERRHTIYAAAATEEEYEAYHSFIQKTNSKERYQQNIRRHYYNVVRIMTDTFKLITSEKHILPDMHPLPIVDIANLYHIGEYCDDWIVQGNCPSNELSLLMTVAKRLRPGGVLYLHSLSRSYDRAIHDDFKNIGGAREWIADIVYSFGDGSLFEPEEESGFTGEKRMYLSSRHSHISLVRGPTGPHGEVPFMVPSESCVKRRDRDKQINKKGRRRLTSRKKKKHVLNAKVLSAAPTTKFVTVPRNMFHIVRKIAEKKEKRTKKSVKIKKSKIYYDDIGNEIYFKGKGSLSTARRLLIVSRAGDEAVFGGGLYLKNAYNLFVVYCTTSVSVTRNYPLMAEETIRRLGLAGGLMLPFSKNDKFIDYRLYRRLGRLVVGGQWDEVITHAEGEKSEFGRRSFRGRLHKIVYNHVLQSNERFFIRGGSSVDDSDENSGRDETKRGDNRTTPSGFSILDLRPNFLQEKKDVDQRIAILQEVYDKIVKKDQNEEMERENIIMQSGVVEFAGSGTYHDVNTMLCSHALYTPQY